MAATYGDAYEQYEQCEDELLEAVDKYNLTKDLSALRLELETNPIVHDFQDGLDTALSFAVDRHHRDAVKACLDLGADVAELDLLNRILLDSRDLTRAISKLALVLELGVNPNTGLWPPLHSAIRRGSLHAVELLIRKGADVNAVDTDNDYTPLMCAASMEELDIVKALLRYGADRNFANWAGETVLSVAPKTFRNLLREVLASVR